MNKGKKLKLAIGLIIGTLICLIGLNYFFSFDAENVTQIIGASIGGIVLLFTATVSSKTNNQIDLIKIDVSQTKKDITEIKKDHVFMKVGMVDISDSFNHKRNIITLCKKIESNTSNTFEKHYDISEIVKDYIIQVNDKIGQIIKDQYEYGFENFNTDYFNRKIKKGIDQIAEHINYAMINKETFKKINRLTSNNILDYIGELKYIKDLENGKRRKEFENLTLKLTNRITNHTIEIYSNSKIKTA